MYCKLFKIGQCSHFHNFPYFYTTIGNYSCLLAELHLSRSLGFHMVQSYLPTILIVVISWVSFWMDVDSVAGRTTLGVTTLLTVSSKASGMYAILRWVVEFLTGGSFNSVKVLVDQVLSKWVQKSLLEIVLICKCYC